MLVNLLEQFVCAIMVKHYLSKKGGTQLPIKYKRGTQQEKVGNPWFIEFAAFALHQITQIFL